MLHTVKTQQLISSDLPAAWSFMSDPRNLAAITPPYLGFRILGGNEGAKMYPGQIIEYYVSPLLGIKLHWVTEITHVQHQEFFVDEQRFGPYAFWHHKHFLQETSEGVMMTDLVHYKLPLGPLGRLANAIFVKKQLSGIFSYRHQALEKIFNGNGA